MIAAFLSCAVVLTSKLKAKVWNYSVLCILLYVLNNIPHAANLASAALSA